MCMCDIAFLLEAGVSDSKEVYINRLLCNHGTTDSVHIDDMLLKITGLEQKLKKKKINYHWELHEYALDD